MSAFPEPDAAEFFLPKLPPSPYPGLRPFEKSEWPIFFGRERMTDEVIEQLLQRQLVVVHGASGDGKSSLVRAGVQARLEQQHARSGLRWRSCWMRPGGRPLANLADALVGLFADPAKLPWLDVRRALNRGGRAPESLIQLLALEETDRVCILFDQFEELFRFEREVSHEESSLLTDFLVGFLESPPPGMHVLVTMRSEFMGECARFDGLAETINRTQYLLPRMNIDDLLRAVREPAALYGGTVTERLAERLVADARGGQDGLPLVQHGLSLLWQVGAPTADAERGPILDLADYEARGPLDRLLSEHADSVLNAAAGDSAGQKIIEELFRALTDTTADCKAIRRPQSFRALLAVTGATEDRLRSILDAFRQPGVSFVTLYPPVPIDAETMIDVSHEALIRRWHKVADPQRGWLQQEIKDGLMWRALIVEAESFKKNPKSLLSEAATEERGGWLKGRNEAWALRYCGDWSGVEDLLEASRREVERQHQKAKGDRVRERDEQERRTRDAEALAAANLRTAKRTRLWLDVALLFAVVAFGFGIWALRETIVAERHLNTAVAVVEGLLAQLPKLRDQGIRADQLKGILDNVVKNEEKLRTTAADNPGLQQALANSLRETSKTLVELGDTRSAREKAEKARDVAQELVKLAPDNDRWAQDLWKCHNQIGDVLQEQNKFDEALRFYKDGLEIAKPRAEKDRSKAERQLDLLISDWTIGHMLEQQVISDWTIGHMLEQQGKLDEAVEYLKAALAIAKQHAGKDQSQTVLEYDRWRWAIDFDMGIVVAMRGKIDEALAYLEEALAITEDRAHTGLSDPEWQLNALRTNLLISIMQPAPPGRRLMVDNAIDKSQVIESQLTAKASESPYDAKLQRQLAIIKVLLGDRLRDEKKFEGAATYYTQAHAARQTLAARDPSNMRWQRELREIHDKIGDVLVKQDKLDDALVSYRGGLAITQARAAKDPSNTDLQRTLAFSDDKIGDVLVKQGKLDDALASFKEGLAIRQALAEKDKTNAQWKSDLMASAWMIGSIAYQFDLAGTFPKALAASDLAISLAPDETWLYTNRAHALMFLGHVDEARAIYLQHRGEQSADKKWEDAIRADFVELRNKGLTNPLMDDIEGLFAEKNGDSNAPPVGSRPHPSAKQP